MAVEPQTSEVAVVHDYGTDMAALGAPNLPARWDLLDCRT